MSDGHLVGKGFGLKPYYSSTTKVWGEYNISDYSYSTLETTVSLDKKWTKGNLGKTEVVIYADNVKLYAKTFTNTTPVQNVKLPFPKNTKHLSFYVLQEKGTQGNHAVIFENPVLTNSLKSLPADDTTSLYDLGVSDSSDAYIGEWIGQAFQMAEGKLIRKRIRIKTLLQFDY